MGAEPEIAEIASALADRSRATMRLLMMDGSAWRAGDLAERAGIAPSTASEHLARLLEAGLVSATRVGRSRYYALAGPAVADPFETLAGLAPPGRIGSLSEDWSRAALVLGRTCCDHLAGRLGVAVVDALVRRGALTPDELHLTERGDALLRRVGVDLTPNRGLRPSTRQCLDWTERRSHLGGAAGAAIAAWAFDNGWLVRIGSGRAVRPTPEGVVAMRTHLGVAIDEYGLDAIGSSRQMTA